MLSSPSPIPSVGWFSKINLYEFLTFMRYLLWSHFRGDGFWWLFSCISLFWTVISRQMTEWILLHYNPISLRYVMLWMTLDRFYPIVYFSLLYMIPFHLSSGGDYEKLRVLTSRGFVVKPMVFDLEPGSSQNLHVIHSSPEHVHDVVQVGGSIWFSDMYCVITTHVIISARIISTRFLTWLEH